jgi:5-methyltetrahydropteroyltriglutamate--homocysteine methyltransferase
MAIVKTLPSRADHVGSFLRPKSVADAREQWRAGVLSVADLKQVEDDAIRAVVAMQERAGLKAVTDGEFRRDYWHLDYLGGIGGVEISGETYGMAFQGGITVGTPLVSGKVGEYRGAMNDHFRFLKSTTTQTAKFCIPAPGMTYMRGGRQGISTTAYPDLDAFWADLATSYQNEVKTLEGLGCTYLQFDDTSFAYLCDANFRAQVTARGDDPDKMVERFAKTTSQAIAKRSDKLLVTTHMCRGNFKSTWMMQGGYEPVAEIMFANLHLDAYFMEFDTDRAGSFEPLRFFPKTKTLVLGLITTKFGELEDKDFIKRRLDQAAKYVPMERLALSPQCGFASTHHGNEVSEDDQRRKLDLVVELADEVWGGA